MMLSYLEGRAHQSIRLAMLSFVGRFQMSHLHFLGALHLVTEAFVVYCPASADVRPNLPGSVVCQKGGGRVVVALECQC